MLIAVDLWALQTSHPNPNLCPLLLVTDYKVIPPSLSCGNWISLRDLWKLPPRKLLVEFSKSKLQHGGAESGLLFLSEGADGSGAQLETEAEARKATTPQVRPACRASLSARWPRCQQAGLGLIKDVEPKWRFQHLLALRPGGWRQSAEGEWPWGEAHLNSLNAPLQKNQNPSVKKTFQRWRLCLTWNKPRHPEV